MHKSVRVSYEKERGCGYRKTGGKYLVGGGSIIPCGRLPIPLDTCPVCSAGFKPARGWTWIDADRLIRACKEGASCSVPLAECAHCAIEKILRAGIVGQSVVGKAGMIWVGEKFYPTVGDFQKEALQMGISRRLNSIPREFKLGETYVLLAHRKAVAEHSLHEDGSVGEIEFSPGIFRIWKPTEIEIIVEEDTLDEKIEEYKNKGWTPVQVVRLEEKSWIDSVSLEENIGIVTEEIDPTQFCTPEYLAGLEDEEAVE